MRLFVALDIEAFIRARLEEFVAAHRHLAPEARWVGAQTFHITLKFIGERRVDEAEAMRQALARIQAAPVTLRFCGTGFFPNPRSARVFWVGIEADASLAALAQRVDRGLSQLQVAPEERPFSPHLTLARGGDARHPRGGSGRPHFQPGDQATRCFAALQEALQEQPAPDFGVMTAHEFFLYESKLSPAGVQYTKLARFPLAEG
jgi:2'-5' RNA ligase